MNKEEMSRIVQSPTSGHPGCWQERDAMEQEGNTSKATLPKDGPMGAVGTPDLVTLPNYMQDQRRGPGEQSRKC